MKVGYFIEVVCFDVFDELWVKVFLLLCYVMGLVKGSYGYLL